MFAALLLALAVLVPVGTAQAAPTPADNAPGSQRLAACMQSARTVSALFVLDVSSSLAGNDPNGVRYDGLRTALTSLSRLERPDGEGIVVEAAVSSFGDDYHPAKDIVPWQRVNGPDPAGLIDDMVDLARDRTSPVEGTDFARAIVGGLNDLADRAGPDTCRIMLWFTDGAWEAGAPSVDAARVRMCQPGGTIDQLREAGITLISLRLNAGGALTGGPLDMESMALGDVDNTVCGTTPIPESSASGVFLEANDSAGLRRIFEQIVNIAEGCTPTDDLGAVVDPGIRRVRVNISTPAQIDEVAFDLPGGISFLAPTRGSSEHSGIRVNSIADDFYVSMEIALPVGVGIGEWFVSTNPAVTPSAMEFCVFSDLHLALDTATTGNLPAGASAIVGVQVLDAHGNPADLTVFGSTGTSATLVGSDGQPRTANPSVAPSNDRVDVFFQSQSGDARLDLETVLEITTRSGLRLTELRSKDSLLLTLNEYFPRVTPLDRLDLGEALRLEPASATFELRGSAKGPTQVCLDAPTSVVVPADATDAQPTYPVGCIDLAPDEIRTVTVTVSTTTAAEGSGSAVTPMTLHAAKDPNGVAAESQAAVPVEWRFSNPLNVGVLFWLLLAICALSVLLPLGAVLLANWLTGRFDVTGLRVASDQLLIDETGVHRSTPLTGRPEALLGDEGRLVIPSGTKRSLLPGLWGRRLVRTFGVGGVTFRSRTPWNPFRPTRLWAESPKDTVLLSTYGGTGIVDKKPNTAAFAAGFSLAAFWVAQQSEFGPSGPVNGTVVVLNSDRQGTGESADAVVRSAGWPASVGQYRSEAASPAGFGSPRDGDPTPPPALPPPPAIAGPAASPPPPLPDPT